MINSTERSLRNKSGNKINPATEDKQDLIISSVEDILLNYQLVGVDDEDTESGVVYLGYLNRYGGWVLKKFEDGEILFAKGASGYDWSNIAAESYDTFDAIF